jgi:hypothetical protein
MLSRIAGAPHLLFAMNCTSCFIWKESPMEFPLKPTNAPLLQPSERNQELLGTAWIDSLLHHPEAFNKDQADRDGQWKEQEPTQGTS